LTYVQYVDCSKWKKVLGISLWIGLTIGLGFIFNFTIGLYGTEQYGLFECHDYLSGKGSDPYVMVTTHCEPQLSIETFFLIIAGLANAGNYFMIWRTLNNHYRWIEIRCGQKPDDTLSKESTE
jgi:hypothetical protein